MDCAQAVVHIMQPTFRQYYHLEELWGERPVRLKLGSAKPAQPAAAKATAAGTCQKRARAEHAPLQRRQEGRCRGIPIQGRAEEGCGQGARKNLVPAPAKKVAVKAAVPAKAPVKTVVVKPAVKPAAKSAAAKPVRPKKRLPRKPQPAKPEA